MYITARPFSEVPAAMIEVNEITIICCYYIFVYLIIHDFMLSKNFLLYETLRVTF